MKTVQHSINMAALRSGLTPHVIRVWERRYGAVKPTRTQTNRRLYSDEEIERLGLLGKAVGAGYRISNIAKLDLDDLRQLLATARETPPTDNISLEERATVTSHDFEGRCLEAVGHMDARGLEDAMTRALIVLGHQGLLKKVVAPLAHSVGELWAQGSLTAAHEHFASAFLRGFLGNTSRPYALSDTSPILIVATPSGQLHELGAIIIASAAHNLGWCVLNLGASLPAAEIAGAAIRKKARAVALSLVYPSDDPLLPGELTNLRRLMPSRIHLLAGGRASVAYQDTLNAIGAFQSLDLETFGSELNRLRHGDAKD